MSDLRNIVFENKARSAALAGPPCTAGTAIDPSRATIFYEIVRQ